jgi:hypothetical protein
MKKEVKEMRCLKDQNVVLSDNEALLLSSIINSLGSGDHIFAEKDTLEYFMIEYCLELCDEARPLLTEEGVQVLNSIVIKLLLADTGAVYDEEEITEFTTAILKRKAKRDKD